jgi:hypothetical protein
MPGLTIITNTFHLAFYPPAGQPTDFRQNVRCLQTVDPFFSGLISRTLRSLKDKHVADFATIPICLSVFAH